jgi:hypothetical protein
MLLRKSIQGVGFSKMDRRRKATNLRRGCPDREIWDTVLADGGAGVRSPSDLVAMVLFAEFRREQEVRRSKAQERRRCA